MRKSSFFLVIFISVFLFSCKPSAEKQMIGTWKLNRVQSNQVIPERDVELYNKAIEKILVSTILTFNEDFSYKGSIWGDTTSGIWSIEPSQMILTISDSQTGEKVNIYVSNLNAQSFEIHETSEGITSVLTFTKI
jgi:ligand-binding sensor domain-containing protein